MAYHTLIGSKFSTVSRRVDLIITGNLDLIKYGVIPVLQIMRLKFRVGGFSRSYGSVVSAGGRSLGKVGAV